VGYKGVSGLHFENVAIAEFEGTLDFFTLDGDSSGRVSQLSSFRLDVLEKERAFMPDFDKRLKIRQVKTLTMRALLAKYNVSKVDLLHIDTEGYDAVILEQFDFSRFQPSIVLFESEHLAATEYKQALVRLRTFGYKIFFRDGHDTICLRSFRDL